MCISVCRIGTLPVKLISSVWQLRPGLNWKDFILKINTNQNYILTNSFSLCCQTTIYLPHHCKIGVNRCQFQVHSTASVAFPHTHCFSILQTSCLLPIQMLGYINISVYCRSRFCKIRLLKLTTASIPCISNKDSGPFLCEEISDHVQNMFPVAKRSLTPPSTRQLNKSPGKSNLRMCIKVKTPDADLLRTPHTKAFRKTFLGHVCCMEMD